MPLGITLRGMGVPHRCHLGTRFTEGSRQIWIQLPKAKLDVEEFTRKAGWGRGVLLKLMYGDREPNRRQSVQLHEILGIDPAEFDKPPKREFVPPAARTAAA